MRGTSLDVHGKLARVTAEITPGHLGEAMIEGRQGTVIFWESRLADHLAEAGRILADPLRPPGTALSPLEVGPDFEALRWFWLSEEIASEP